MRFALLGWIALAGCTQNYDGGGELEYPATADGMKQFFTERCSNCHGYAPGQGALELPLDVADVVVAGDADASVLWQRLEAGEMPPAGNFLEPETYAHVYDWIAAGDLEL